MTQPTRRDFLGSGLAALLAPFGLSQLPADTTPEQREIFLRRGYIDEQFTFCSYLFPEGVIVTPGNGGFVFREMNLIVRHPTDGRRPQVEVYANRITGPYPLMARFYEQYGDVCKAKANDLYVGLTACAKDTKEHVPSWLKLEHVILTAIGLSVMACGRAVGKSTCLGRDHMMISEQVQMLAIGEPQPGPSSMKELSQILPVSDDELRRLLNKVAPPVQG